MDTDEGLYHAIPQTRGKIAHQSIDTKKASNRKDDLLSFPVFSEKYRLMGKVDMFRKKEKGNLQAKTNTKRNHRTINYRYHFQMF